MKLKFLPAIFAFLCTTLVLAQKKDAFGNLTSEEKNFTSFEQDSTAGAIVLYEKGDNYFQVIQRRIYLVKEYHGKIKILNEKGFDEGTISIPYYKGDSSSESVKDIKALTHNGIVRTGLRAEQIFTNKVNERWSEKKFTFPNIKIGRYIGIPV